MEPIARKSDGRRIFTPEFKRQQVERVLRGELTISELGRELGISRNLLARWKTLVEAGAETAVAECSARWPSPDVNWATATPSSGPSYRFQRMP